MPRYSEMGKKGERQLNDKANILLENKARYQIISSVDINKHEYDYIKRGRFPILKPTSH
jgi:hypothetical protein